MDREHLERALSELLGQYDFTRFEWDSHLIFDNGPLLQSGDRAASLDLHFQEVRAADAAVAADVEAALSLVLPPLDREGIAGLVAVARVRRSSVTKVRLHADGALELEFSCGNGLIFPTDVSIVDWYWSIAVRVPGAVSGPYRGHELATSYCPGLANVQVDEPALATLLSRVDGVTS